MEASGSQVKSVPGRVTVGEESADVALEVVASAGRVEIAAGADGALRISVARNDLLLALGVTEAEVRDL